MKVVLVDPLLVNYKKLSSDRESFSGYVPIQVSESAFHPPQKVEERGQDVNMFKDVCPLSFKIEKKEEKVTVFLYSNTKDEGNCVLERLWDRFQDRVSISMMIWMRKEEQVLLDFASVEGMLIENKSDGCITKGSSTTNMVSLILTAAPVNFKVTVDIPDECGKNCFDNENSINRKILETTMFTDAIIVAGNGAEIKAHKCFLCISSPVLAAMFQNDMKESQTGRVEMTDISEQGIRAFLQFIYCRDLKMAKEDPKIAVELLLASHKYDMPRLELKMVKCVMGIKNKDFSVALAFKVYMFVRNMVSKSAVEWKRKCVSIFYMKPDELESLQEYQDLFEKNPKVAMEVSRDFLTSVFRRK